MRVQLSLSAGAGDDTLIGGGGSDLLDGGDGTDTTYFAGTLADYKLEREGDHVVVIRGAERDLLFDVEWLQFDDALIDASTIGTAPAPVAVDDSASTNEDAAVTVAVLANDVGQGLELVGASEGANGSVTLNLDGTITYRPHADQHGQDSFSYTVQDTSGIAVSATVWLDVAAVNDAPLAVDDVFVVTAGGPFAGSSVLANDSDVDGDSLVIVDFDSLTAAGGTVSMAADGSFTYSAPESFSGSDSFAYTASDGNGGSDGAIVSLDVQQSSALPDWAEALIHDAWRQNYPGPLGTADSVTFTFLEEVPDYYPADATVRSSFQAFSQSQRADAREVLQTISGFAAIDFIEVTSPEQADLTFALADGGLTGWLLAPSSDGTGTQSNDLWLSATEAGVAFVPGSDIYWALLHEVGHALGMEHPEAPMPYEENNQRYTLMSGGSAFGLDTKPQSFMQHDIAALQLIYGARSGGGDDVYSFTALAGALLTIQDGGGHDHLDLSGATYGVAVDLAPGAFSTVAPYGWDNVALARDTVLEDLTGGAHDDRLTGNDAGNRIESGGGNDTLAGGGGGDLFVFGPGSGSDRIEDFERGVDLLDFSGAASGYAALDLRTVAEGIEVSHASGQVLVVGVAALDESNFDWGLV